MPSEARHYEEGTMEFLSPLKSIQLCSKELVDPYNYYRLHRDLHTRNGLFIFYHITQLSYSLFPVPSPRKNECPIKIPPPLPKFRGGSLETYCFWCAQKSCHKEACMVAYVTTLCRQHTSTSNNATSHHRT